MGISFKIYNKQYKNGATEKVVFYGGRVIRHLVDDKEVSATLVGRRKHGMEYADIIHDPFINYDEDKMVELGFTLVYETT